MNQINTKSFWKYKKRLCVRWLGVINLTWENLQIARHKSVRWAERTPSWFVLCDLYIFSGKVYHPAPPHAQSLFLFPIYIYCFWYYRKRRGASYIVREVRSVREREIQREREIDGSDVTLVALNLAKKFALFVAKTLKLAKSFALSLPKMCTLVSPLLS